LEKYGLVSRFNEEPPIGYKHIPFNPDYQLNSITKYSTYIKNNIQRSTKENRTNDFVDLLRITVASNYKHNSLKYNCYVNWLPCLISKSKLPKLSYLLYVLDPNDIAKAKHAMCSQQAILVQSILSDFSYNYASLKLTTNTNKGHFATVAFINNQSYIIDTNIMPKILHRKKSLDKILTYDNNILINAYGQWFPNSNVIKGSLSHFSIFPAKRGLLFQQFIFTFQRYIASVPLLLIIIKYIYKTNRKFRIFGK
tara:strand:+ start:1502 stop:2260 length:759 start_codon:yes stop_codon:yes gene_type:complete